MQSSNIYRSHPLAARILKRSSDKSLLTKLQSQTVISVHYKLNLLLAGQGHMSILRRMHAAGDNIVYSRKAD